VKAFRRVAVRIRDLAESLDEMVRRGEDLTQFPGTGAAIASAIREGDHENDVSVSPVHRYVPTASASHAGHGTDCRSSIAPPLRRMAKHRH